jgi:predicted RNase H-like nuclease (RuvC/YqgF family)
MPGTSAETTLAALMQAVLDIKDQVADVNLVAATTASAVTELRKETNTRHEQNKREIDKIRSGITESNASVKRVEAELKSVGSDVADMKPAVTRWRASEAFRAAFYRCARRWWGRGTVLAVGAGALFAWLDGHLPKIAALLRKLGIMS